jgi:hypothetical protein
MALVIISGAIFFHLFTPLGVEIKGDGGLLFTLACGVWLSSVAILLIHRRDVIALVQTIIGFVRKDKVIAHEVRRRTWLIRPPGHPGRLCFSAKCQAAYPKVVVP